MEFTAEQQAYIDNLIVEKTTGLFTEDELNRRVTSEVDRRVESGIQKGLETHKAKWEKEFQAKAQLTAEELAQQEFENKVGELNAREQELARRANTLNAKDLLSNVGIPKRHYDKFIDLLVSDDEDSTISNVQNFIDTFNQTKTELESEIQKKYVNIPQPEMGEGESTLTKEEFNKLSYMEKIKVKETNPELYKNLMR